jgi:hypothetical protein
MWAGILSWFLAGGLVGGILMGALLTVPARGLYNLIGSAPMLFLVISAVVSALYLTRVFNILKVPRPQFPHQVPEAWRNVFSSRVASFVYAAGLGTIYFTRLGSLVAYPLVILLLGMGKFPLAVIEVMASIGLVRAVTVLLVPWRRLDVAPSQAVVQLMERHSPTFRRGDSVVLLMLVIAPIGWLVIH